jgi:Tfp pilus assembly protein PilN
MIKVNLLESVTDRSGGVAAVEARVSSPRGQGLLVTLVAVGLLLAGATFDYLGATAAKASAQNDLAREQEVAARMQAIKKEMQELEKRTQEVQTRIDAIKKLRSAQQGPVAVLSSLNERLPKLADFKLASIELKGDELTVKGDSPDEASVTQFGRGMEFSNGLFSNVSIEIKRDKLDVPKDAASPLAKDPNPTTVGFTIKCKYTQPGTDSGQPQPQQGAKQAAGQIAQK